MESVIFSYPGFVADIPEDAFGRPVAVYIYVNVEGKYYILHRPLDYLFKDLDLQPGMRLTIEGISNEKGYKRFNFRKVEPAPLTEYEKELVSKL